MPNDWDKKRTTYFGTQGTWWNAAVRVFGNLMLKVKQRSCGGRVIHWKSYCMVKLFLLATAVLIPKLRFLLFFFGFQLCFFYFTYNASIYSSFVLNYLPSRMLAVFALCHFLGGALANFDATRGLGICPGHPWAFHTIMEPKYS